MTSSACHRLASSGSLMASASHLPPRGLDRTMATRLGLAGALGLTFLWLTERPPRRVCRLPQLAERVGNGHGGCLGDTARSSPVRLAAWAWKPAVSVLKPRT